MLTSSLMPLWRCDLLASSCASHGLQAVDQCLTHGCTPDALLPPSALLCAALKVMACHVAWAENAVALQLCVFHSQVLLEESTQRVPAALHGLAVFVDTLRLLVDAQREVATAGASPQHSPSQHSPSQHSPTQPDSADLMDEDAQGPSATERPDSHSGHVKQEAGSEGKRADSPKGVADGRSPGFWCLLCLMSWMVQQQHIEAAY